MKVVPIAWTVVDLPLLEELVPGYDTQRAASQGGADDLAEFAGRNCYLSWNRPNPATATNEGYLANIIRQEHYSVLEHGSVSFYVSGISRALLAELTRHRHLSFSVVSQRYVDAHDLDWVVPPIVDELEDDTQELVYSIIDDHQVTSLETYDRLFEIFTKHGYKRKQSREAARAVLTNATESPLVVTGNVHAWRYVISKRYHIAADKEIQAFGKEVLHHLRHIAPNSVQDMGNDPFGSEEPNTEKKISHLIQELLSPEEQEALLTHLTEIAKNKVSGSG